MKREDIEKNLTISPLAKLIAEWLSRRDPQAFGWKEVAAELGVMPNGLVSDEAYAMKRVGLLLKEHNGEALPIGVLVLSPEARAAYVPTIEEKKKK